MESGASAFVDAYDHITRLSLNTRQLRSMRCFIDAPSARESGRGTTPSTMWTASLLLTCLLALAGFSDAARTPQQRKADRNPYLILPPSATGGYEDGRPSRDLGERSFVWCIEGEGSGTR